MISTIKVSLCISTYNRPMALNLCLQSVLAQTVLPFEVIISDDGSTIETKNLIETFIKNFPIPIIHQWQEDDGYRLAASRNNGFRVANGNYIIQVDGDLILHKKFVQHHIQFAKPNTFLCGSRSMINVATTKVLEDSMKIDVDLIRQNISKKYNAFDNVLLAKLYYYFKRGIAQTKYVLGANMSFYKEDILRINGYNEEFVGWGKEDNDLAIRLCKANVDLRFIKHAAIVYHLHHKELPRNFMDYNQTILQSSKSYYAKNGIVK